MILRILQITAYPNENSETIAIYCYATAQWQNVFVSAQRLGGQSISSQVKQKEIKNVIHPCLPLRTLSWT